MMSEPICPTLDVMSFGRKHHASVAIPTVVVEAGGVTVN
jgi:hypothetical protein